MFRDSTYTLGLLSSRGVTSRVSMQNLYQGPPATMYHTGVVLRGRGAFNLLRHQSPSAAAISAPHRDKLTKQWHVYGYFR